MARDANDLAASQDKHADPWRVCTTWGACSPSEAMAAARLRSRKAPPPSLAVGQYVPNPVWDQWELENPEEANRPKPKPTRAPRRRRYKEKHLTLDFLNHITSTGDSGWIVKASMFDDFINAHPEHRKDALRARLIVLGRGGTRGDFVMPPNVTQPSFNPKDSGPLIVTEKMKAFALAKPLAAADRVHAAWAAQVSGDQAKRGWWREEKAEQRHQKRMKKFREYEDDNGTARQVGLIAIKSREPDPRVEPPERKIPPERAVNLTRRERRIVELYIAGGHCLEHVARVLRHENISPASRSSISRTVIDLRQRFANADNKNRKP